MRRNPLLGSVDSDNELLKAMYNRSIIAIDGPYDPMEMKMVFEHFRRVSMAYNQNVEKAIKEMQATVKSYLRGRRSRQDAMTSLRRICDRNGMPPMWADMERWAGNNGNNTNGLRSLVGNLERNINRGRHMTSKRFR